MTESAPRTVVVADADEGICSLVTLTLDGDSYKVIEASDAESALRAVASHLPSVVLLDRELPGADALKVARSLKAQPETAGAYIVLLYKKTEQVDAEGVKEYGVDDILAKPFNGLTLLKKLDLG